MVSVSVPVSVMANKGSDTTESGNNKKTSKKNSSLEESIKKKQEEINKAEEEREKLKGSLTDVKKVVQGLEKSKEDVCKQEEVHQQNEVQGQGFREEV
jgi:uncharacterized protein YlxW (UPF0749 family)